MEREEIKERVYQVVSQVLKIDSGQIQEEHMFTTDLGAESVQSVDLDTPVRLYVCCTFHFRYLRTPPLWRLARLWASRPCPSARVVEQTRG